MAADTKMSLDAFRVRLLPLVVLLIAPAIVMSLAAATVCSVVAPLKLLALTVKVTVVFKLKAPFVITTVATLLLVLVAVSATALTVSILLLAEMAPLIVMAPLPPTVAAAESVTAPACVAAVALVLIKAPALLLSVLPAPAMLMALFDVWPFRSTKPPLVRVMVPVTAKVPVNFSPDVAPMAISPDPVMAATVVMTPLLKVKVPLLVMAPAPKTPPVFSCKLAEAMVVPPVYMLVLVKMTVPLLVESPTVSAPVPAPEMMPLKVAVLVVAAASLFAPVSKVMALLTVPVLFTNKVPPLMVTTLVDKPVAPLVPPEATDMVPAAIKVVPL